MTLRVVGSLLTLVLVVATPLRAQDVLTLPRAVQEALARNRSLQAARTGVREADAQVTTARSAYFPKISFVESWQRGDQPVFVFSSLLASRRFTASNFAIDSLNSPDPTAFFHGAVSFEQIVFDGGRTSASVESAALERDMASLTADDAAADVAVAVTEAYGRVLTARTAVRAADAAIAAAREDLTRATLRRDAGSLSDADVLAVSVHLADARRRQIQAAGDEDVAKAELNRLTGAAIDREYDVELPPLDPARVRESAPLRTLFDEAESRRPDLRRAAAAERVADAGRRGARSSWYPQIAAQGGVEADGTQIGTRASSWIVGAEARWTLSTGGAEAAGLRAAAEAVVRARLEHEDARAAAQVEIAGALRRLEAAIARRDVGQASADAARESERIVRDRFEAGIASTSDLLRAAAAAFDADTERASAAVEILVSRARLDRALGRSPSAATRPLP